MNLELSDTRVYEPQVRARLGTTAYEVLLALCAGGGGGIERRNLNHLTHRTFVDTPASQVFFFCVSLLVVNFG